MTNARNIYYQESYKLF